jgi:hypothetical protein
MRIHSNSLDSLEIRKAARRAGVSFTRFDLKGSRSHEAAFDVILTGASSRRQNGGEDQAATWDQWGIFLGTMFSIDPAMVCGTVKRPIYADADHFHWVTANRFREITPADYVVGHNHRWEFAGQVVTGAYTVHECKSADCLAVVRYGDWARVSA